MKVAIVPAQVTTIEDKIIGSLSSKQSLLLVGPVFGTGLLLALAPPYMAISAYKLVFILITALISALLAIRFKSKLILEWLIIGLRYRMRPRIYVYNKQTWAYREVIDTDPTTKKVDKKLKDKPKLAVLTKEQPKKMNLKSGQWVYLRNKKGVTNVYFRQN